MQLLSSAFQQGQPIPLRFTCEGDDISPEFSWKDAPKETKSFVLILHDPDAPRRNGFTHWVVYNIPAEVSRITENVPQEATISGIGSQAKNDAGQIGYKGPCPPSGKHRYIARLYALSAQLPVKPGAAYTDVITAMEKLVIEEAELLGTYEKQSGKVA